MKRIIIIFICAVHSFISFSQQWHLSPVSHGRNVYSVYTHSRTDVVAAGGNESNDSLQDIFYSFSGGMTWDFSNNQGGGYIRSLDFSDSLNGLAVGYAGKILKSGDGGASWYRIYPSGAINQRNFTTVHYKDAQTVLAFGGRNYTNDTLQTIIKSTDGGDTWTMIRDVTGRWLKGAFFINSNTGFAVGGNGTIIKTTDGGNNWLPVSSPVNTRDFNAIYFTTSSVGYIVGGNLVEFDSLNSVRTILKTTDGGNNWNVVMDEAGGWLTAIDFVDQNTGYITGDGAQLYKTTDGGANWIRQTVNGSGWYSNFTSVMFLNQNFGVIGALSGEVFLYGNEPLPEVITVPPTITQVNDTSVNAILRGNINTHGTPVTYNFIYSTTPDFSSDVWAAYYPFQPVPFNSTALQAVEVNVNDLIPDTTYYYYVTATSINGVVNGDTISFFTSVPYQNLNTNAPVVSPFYTVFSGMMDHPTEPMNMFFEYGTTPQFGNEVQATPFSVNDTLNYSFSDTIFTLQPNTLYYYRLKAVSQSNTYYANTFVFFNGTLYSDFQATQATNVTGTTATLNVAVDNFRLPLTNLTFLYGTDPAQFNNWTNGVPSYITDTLQHTVSVNINALTPNTFYYYKITGITAVGQQSSNIVSFYTGEFSLDFQALPATTVGETFATLNGSAQGFIPAHLPATVNFEYGTTTAFGTLLPANPATVTDTLPLNFSAFVSDLLPGTTYYYRLNAQTQAGITYTNLQSFTTPFAGDYFSTLPATEVTPTSAQLNGKISHFSFPVTLVFQYGLTQNFGTQVTANPASINDTLYHALSADITNLVPDTVYFFRIKATYGSQVFYTPARKVFTGVPEIPNWNFEQWEEDTLLITPDWNIISDSTYERVQGYSGNYALKLSATNFAIMGFPGDGSEGALPMFYGGCPFSARPDSVIFYLSYYLNPVDTAYFLIHMRRDTNVIAAQFYPISGNSGGVFQRFSFPINYNLPETPDTIVFAVTTFNPFNATLYGHEQNIIIIDNISFYPAVSNSCNLDFEDWYVYPVDDLHYWYYAKSILINADDLEGSHRVVKTEGTVANEFAVELRNARYLNFWVDSDISNAPNKDLFGGNIRGSNVSRRYQHLNGYYKFFPDGNDTMMIEITFYLQGIQAGYAKFINGTETTAFTPFDIPVEYSNDTIVPDSVVILVKTNNFGTPQGATVAVVDNFSFDGFWETPVDTTGIAIYTMKENGLLVYPNPTKSSFTIEIPGNSSAADAELTDINGRVLKQFTVPAGQERFVMDVSELDAGLYFIKAAVQDKIFCKKIIVLK